MAYAIREALEAFAAPAVRDQILSRALYVAGLESVPERGPMLREFVDRFLRQAMETALDAYSAELAVTGLDPIVRLAEDADQVAPQPKRASPGSRESLDPWEAPINLPPDLGDDADWRSLNPDLDVAGGFEEAPTNQLPKVDADLLEASRSGGRRESANWDAVIDDSIGEVVTGVSAAVADTGDAVTAERPVVPQRSADGSDASHARGAGTNVAKNQQAILFASRDPLVLKAFDECVGNKATVMGAADPLALLEVVQGPEPRPSVLVFDCESPSIQPATLAALAADFPDGASILLWRTNPTLAEELLSLNASGNWKACDPEWGVNQVAEESLALVQEKQPSR